MGLLILINFFTQLIVDLIFSFFSHKFNISKSVKAMPMLTVLGLLIFTVAPWVFPDSVYTGLAIGTVIFSASSGLAEVLISPVIAEIPAKDPDSVVDDFLSDVLKKVLYKAIKKTCRERCR